MEKCEVTVKELVQQLGNYGHKRICQTIISYLSPQDLAVINLQLQNLCLPHAFAEFIKTYHFIHNYLNKMDRTFYYSFYQDSQFIEIQNNHIILLTLHNSQQFLKFPQQFRQCLNFIQKLFPNALETTDFVQELQRILTDSSIPLPKLKRENQGMFCKTSFQNFLVNLKYDKYDKKAEEDCFPPFEDIQLYFQTQQENYLKKLFFPASKNSSLDLKVRSLRFTPFEITFKNYHDFLIEHNSLHNMLVGIFALTDILLCSFQSFIMSLEDPFHRFVDFITRYSIYRNYVMEMEESLSFAFEQYGNLYSDVFGSDNKPEYRFWRGAMTKWLIKFSKYHEEGNSIFYYCLTKLRVQNMMQFLEQKQKDNPQLYMYLYQQLDRSIKNKAFLREYELSINHNSFSHFSSNGIQSYFEQNYQEYTVLAIEYIQYLVDLSINEETVHWCGHSNQPLSQPYLSFEKQILVENKNYLNYICQLEKQAKNSSFRFQFFSQQTTFLENVQIKPLTLRKIIDSYNMCLCDNPTILENFEAIKYDFETKDETLRYFNEKVKIKFNICEEEMYFYSIKPMIPTNELLTKSISTANDSQILGSDQQQPQSYLEYMSSDSCSIHQQQQSNKSEEEEKINCQQDFSS